MKRMLHSFRRGSVGRAASMFTVYVLRDSDGKLYRGFTNNLERRLQEHRSGQNKSTRHLKNVRVVHTEKYNTREDARAREIYLKTAAGRRFLKSIL